MINQFNLVIYSHINIENTSNVNSNGITTIELFGGQTLKIKYQSPYFQCGLRLLNTTVSVCQTVHLFDWFISSSSPSKHDRLSFLWLSLAFLQIQTNLYFSSLHSQHWKLTFTTESGCVCVLFQYERPSIRKSEAHHGPFLSLTDTTHQSRSKELLHTTTHTYTHFISLHPVLIVPRGVTENTLTDELLLTLRAFIWISFHLWEHYGLNMVQSRFCVLELVRYGAALNRAHLQTRTYLRLS